jgi:NADH:ubiquinone oxidoreductase subunit E
MPPRKRKREFGGVSLRPAPKGREIDAAALDEVRALLGDAPRRPDLLIEHLHRLQDVHGYLSVAHLNALAYEMALTPAEVYEVATFYHHFDVVRPGQPAPPPLTVRVCESVSCHLAGADALLGALQDRLGPAGLRGLGGAGFPTAQKWKFVRAEPAPRSSRSMRTKASPARSRTATAWRRTRTACWRACFIAAWAVGADDIFIYLRDEYAACRAILEREIAALAADPPCALPRIHLRRGAGAYICGEETSLIESDRGQARGAAAAAAVPGAGRASSAGRRSCRTSRRCTGCARSSRTAPDCLPRSGRAVIRAAASSP